MKFIIQVNIYAYELQIHKYFCKRTIRGIEKETIKSRLKFGAISKVIYYKELKLLEDLDQFNV